MNKARPFIRDYTDYRKFLGEMYEYRKEQNVHFTFQFIAQKTKTSRGYLKNIIDGRRHFSVNGVMPFAEIFGLNGFELDYLIILVLHNTTADASLKSRFEEILRGLRGALALVPQHFENRQDEGGDFCLTSTLGGAIYAMIEIPDFKFESAWIYAQLANKTKYSIDEIEKAMRRLEELGLIIQENRRYKQGKQVSGVISPYSPREAFRMYQPTAVQLYEVFDDVPAYGYIRVMSAKLPLGDEELPQFEQEFAQFKDRIEAISASAKNPNRVMGFANAIYPLVHIKKD